MPRRKADGADSAYQKLFEEQRRLAEAAEMERAWLEDSLRVAKVGSWQTDLVTLRVKWSDEVFHIFGLDPEGFHPTHTSFLERVHPDDRAAVDAAFMASFASREVYTISHRIVLDDGGIRQVEERWRTVVDGRGKPLRALGTCQDVTARHAAEAAREQQQALLRAAAHLAHLGAFRVDLVTGERHWSDEVCAIHDLPPGRTPSLEEALAFYPQPYRNQMRSMYTACARDGVPYDAALEIVTATGRRRWVRTVAEAVRDPQGRIVGIQGAFQDITERRRATEALMLSEERFRLLAKATNDAIWDWDLVTDTLWWNEGFETLFGYRRDEIEPDITSWSKRIHPDDLERVVDSVHRVIDAGERHWSSEYRFRRKDGEDAFVLDRGYVIRDDTGRAIRMIGGMTDLSDHKRAESRLAQQAALLDAAHEAFIVTDLEDRITYWNRGAERTFGWPAEQALGRIKGELLKADPALYAEARAALRERGQWEGELTEVGRDGRERIIGASWSLVRDRRGRPVSVFAVAADISERKQLEAQVLRTQRMESIGTLAGGIAHDLNNVLTPILASVELLRIGEEDPARLDSLEAVELSARRGAAMVQQVLAFARGTKGQRVSVDVQRIVRDIEKVVQESFPKSIGLKLTSAAGLWRAIGDPTQIHQVLLNLCVNSRDAMPNGGTLTLELGNTTLKAGASGLPPGAPPGPYLRIVVGDTGHGIPPEVSERMFEPFFTTKDTGKGTGLGLSTVHSIVKAHGGFVMVDSAPGQGARFEVLLPADTAAVADGPTAAPVAPPDATPRGQGQTVLVVDDEAAVLKVVQRTLERFGYRVLTAAHGGEALEVYRQHRADIGLVITDMAMPVMDGPATILALKQLDPGLRIIGSSGLTEKDGLAGAVGDRLVAFLPKPYSSDELLTAVDRALRGTTGPAPG